MKKEDILKKVFKTNKPIIGMAHCKALPGSPLYDEEDGINSILESLEKDVICLQEGGIDAIMFGNENDRPYQTKVSQVTIATMSYLIGRIAPLIKVPFGVDVLFDGMATLAVAKATGSSFAREVFTSVYGSDLGLWNTNCAEALRYKDFIKGNDIITLFNINAEFASTIENRPIEDIAKSVVFSSLPDILLVSGNITGEEIDINSLEKVKKAVPETPVFVNTGVNIDNVLKILNIADGAIVGTSLKKDSITWNEINKNRVIEFMKIVRKFRNSI